MKKYLAAAVVAVMVFAFSAFAASLNLDGGVLQAGSDLDLTCTEAATVTYDTPIAAVQGDFRVSAFTVNFDNEAAKDCNELEAHLKVHGDDGGSYQSIAVKEISGNEVVFYTDKEKDPKAEAITGVSVAVHNSSDHGFADGILACDGIGDGTACPSWTDQ